MHKLKIRHLEIFASYMKTRSVTETADAVGTTQPNVSKILKQLEFSFGASLFARVSGRVVPTPEAEVLYEHITRLMRQIDFVEDLALNLSRLNHGSVRIAALSTFGISLLPTVIQRFNDRNPGIVVEIDILDTEKIHSLVSRGMYDLGLVHHPQQEDDLSSYTLMAGSFVCIVSKDHRLAQQPEIKAADLSGLHLITYPTTVSLGAVVAHAIATEGVAVQRSITANHSLIVRKLVENGGGVGLVDEFSVWDHGAGSNLAVRPYLPRIPVMMGLILPARRPLSHAASAFVDELKLSISEYLEPGTRS